MDLYIYFYSLIRVSGQFVNKVNLEAFDLGFQK